MEAKEKKQEAEINKPQERKEKARKKQEAESKKKQQERKKNARKKQEAAERKRKEREEQTGGTQRYVCYGTVPVITLAYSTCCSCTLYILSRV